MSLLELKEDIGLTQAAPELFGTLTTGVLAVGLAFMLQLNVRDVVVWTSFCQALPMAARVTNRAAELCTLLVEV